MVYIYLYNIYVCTSAAPSGSRAGSPASTLGRAPKFGRRGTPASRTPSAWPSLQAPSVCSACLRRRRRRGGLAPSLSTHPLLGRLGEAKRERPGNLGPTALRAQAFMPRKQLAQEKVGSWTRNLYIYVWLLDQESIVYIYVLYIYIYV